MCGGGGCFGGICSWSRASEMAWDELSGWDSCAEEWAEHRDPNSLYFPPLIYRLQSPASPASSARSRCMWFAMGNEMVRMGDQGLGCRQRCQCANWGSGCGACDCAAPLHTLNINKRLVGEFHHKIYEMDSGAQVFDMVTGSRLSFIMCFSACFIICGPEHFLPPEPWTS
jgi:hypothetical protein